MLLCGVKRTLYVLFVVLSIDAPPSTIEEMEYFEGVWLTLINANKMLMLGLYDFIL